MTPFSAMQDDLMSASKSWDHFLSPVLISMAKTSLPPAPYSMSLTSKGVVITLPAISAFHSSLPPFALKAYTFLSLHPMYKTPSFITGADDSHPLVSKTHCKAPVIESRQYI